MSRKGLKQAKVWTKIQLLTSAEIPWTKKTLLPVDMRSQDPVAKVNNMEGLEST